MAGGGVVILGIAVSNFPVYLIFRWPTVVLLIGIAVSTFTIKP